MGETYYEVLGVDRDASTEEIRRAYRERVLETHPDHNDDPDAAAQFSLVGEAESILTDDAERARYDRLGHDAYRRWGSGIPAGGPASNPSDDASAGKADREAGAPSDSKRGAAGSTTSHHARQRYRRRATAAETDWWFDDAASSPSGNGVASPSDSTVDRDGATEAADVGYAVHDWTDDIDIESPFQPLTRRAAIGLATVCSLYPLFVYASLSPAFPIIVNAIVAACTLTLVGYVLTWPRIAAGTFGAWSLVVAAALPTVTGLDPLSLVGGLVTAAFVVPFGLALAVWWALRP